MESRIRKLNKYVTGWLAYYALYTRSDLENLEKWIRRRLRLCMWSGWRLGKTRLRKLMGLGLSREYAGQIAYSSRGGWRISLTPQLHKAMGTRFWEAQGLVSMMKRYGRIREGWRTAVYGTVRTVV